MTEPGVDPDALDPMVELMRSAIPFAQYAGTLVDEIAPGRGVASLAPQPHHLNHVGTVHAGAQFTLGETASGAALMGLVAARITELVPVARNASISYRAPASGPLVSTARTEMTTDALLAEIDQHGKATFVIDVDTTMADGTVVSTMTVEWHVSRTR